MKIAIVHEWFVDYSGSEKVLEQILNIYPNADLYSLVDFLPQDLRFFIKNKEIKTSLIQKLPFSRKIFRNYLPLMSLAVEQFDLSAYDIVISNNHCVAKNVITAPNQLHVSYVHSPIRYAWDKQAQYLQETGLDTGFKGLITQYILHLARINDLRGVNGVDEYLCNSRYISKRIWKHYRRLAEVIYPPVDVETFNLKENKENFYVTASRMVPYKKMDLIVEAFTKMPDKKLVVIGNGPDFEKIKRLAGSNIEILGFQETSILRDYMSRAKAFIFAAEEDFGITPVEAQACGTPIIAYRKGGVLETVIEGKTGLFFDKQEIQSLINAVKGFEKTEGTITPWECRVNAEKFSVSNFVNTFRDFMENKISNFKENIS